jgi:hypothetical protein
VIKEKSKELAEFSQSKSILLIIFAPDNKLTALILKPLDRVSFAQQNTC